MVIEMSYTVYFSLKEIRYYSDDAIAEMNKTFTRAFRRELTRLEKLTEIPFNRIRDSYWSDSKYDDSLCNRYFHEDAMDCCFIDRNFNFNATDRKIYDIAIKKAILAVQRKFNDPLKASCDDGFIYTKNGIKFTGIGLSKEFEPVRTIKVKLHEMPIVYQNKEGEAILTEKYDWMEINNI